MADKDLLMDNAEAESRHRNAFQDTLEAEREARIAWWREARFGMFIHWGLYSLLGGEWKGQTVNANYAEHIQLRGQIPVKEYEQVAKEFNPVKFDADEWVRSAKEAGMKYMVITAKHHDGFAMYDSKVSDFNLVKDSPYGRDPMVDLAKACQREGIKLCFYYSHSMDWHHPDSQGNTLDYPDNIGAWDPLESWVDDEDKRTRYERYLEQKAFPQVEELLTGYGPVGIIWFDCGHKVTDVQGQKFVDLVHGLQPGCLVNRRVRRDGFGDYGNSGDNQLHIRVNRKDWESIHTLNNSWGYRKADNDWKSVKDILHSLIDVLSMNGNYLLNVGPTGEGEFDPKSVELLKQIGNWMKQNGESVYGTTGSPIGKPQWGRVTAKSQKLYLHVFEWPASRELVVPGIRNPITNAYLLADPNQTSLEVERLNELDISIQVPAEPLDDSSTVIVLEYAQELDANPLKLLVAKDYLNRFGAFDGEIQGKNLRYDTGKKGHDNVTNWTNPDDSVSWQFRAAEPGVYRVQASFGADETFGGSFAVSVANQTLRAEVHPTGGPYLFQDFEIGRLEIPAAGEYTLSVKPVAITGAALMNLQQIGLKKED